MTVVNRKAVKLYNWRKEQTTTKTKIAIERIVAHDTLHSIHSSYKLMTLKHKYILATNSTYLQHVCVHTFIYSRNAA